MGDFLTWLVIFLVLMWGIGRFVPYDDTDDIENKQRSGLALYTDHATGLQYLKAGLFGGITPRLDENGNHMRVHHESDE